MKLMSILIFIFIVNCTISIYPDPKAKAGILNLQSYTVENTIVKLDGEWEFYWEKLLCSDDFSKMEDKSISYIIMPGFWNNLLHNNRQNSGKGYGTVRLKIKLNNKYEKDSIWGLKIPDILTAYKLFINGELIAYAGKVSDNQKDSQSQYLPKVVYFNLPDKDIELIIQISNYEHIKIGIPRSIYLGLQDKIQERERIDFSYEIFMFSALILMGFYQLITFLIKKANIIAILFAIFCFVMSLRILLTGSFIFFIIFPDFNWEWGLKIGYFTIYYSYFIYVLFITTKYTGRISKILKYCVGIITLILTFIVILFPASVYTRTIGIYQFTMFTASIIMMIILISAIRHKKDNSVITLFGGIVLYICMANDVVESLGIIQIGQLMPLGMFIFVLLYSIMIAQDYAVIFDRLDFLFEKINLYKKNKREKFHLRKQIYRNANIKNELLSICEIIYYSKKDVTAEILALRIYGNTYDHFMKKVNKNIRTIFKKLYTIGIIINNLMDIKNIIPKYFSYSLEKIKELYSQNEKYTQYERSLRNRMRNTINTLQKKVDSMTEEVDSKEKEVLKLKAEKYESRKELYKKAGLTLREKRICEIIIDSNIIENKLIGRELGERHSDAIGVKAVERELTSIYAKFGLSKKKQFRKKIQLINYLKGFSKSDESKSVK